MEGKEYVWPPQDDTSKERSLPKTLKDLTFGNFHVIIDMYFILINLTLLDSFSLLNMTVTDAVLFDVSSNCLQLQSFTLSGKVLNN